MRALRLLLVTLLPLTTGCPDDPVPQRFAPVASAPAVAHVEAGGTVTITVTGADDVTAEADLEVAVSQLPANGTTLPSGARAPAVLTYTPDADFFGVDAFAVTVTDADGLTSAPATVVVVVAPPAAPAPVDETAPTPIGPSFLIVAEDQPTDFALTGSDDFDAESELTVSVTVPPSLGTVDVDTGASPLLITYTPNADVHGVDTLAFKVTDSAGNQSAPELVAIVVESVNDAPAALNDTAATDSLTPVTINVTANDSDADGDLLLIVSVTDPASGAITFDAAGGTVTYWPDNSGVADDTFDYTVRDAAGIDATASVTVAITQAPAVVITGFVAAQPYPMTGDAVTLTWTSAQATECWLDHGLDTAGLSAGSIDWIAASTTTFTLTCEGPGGPVTAQATVSPWPYDSDDDGLHDMLEVLVGSDPYLSDTDGDLLPDGIEDADADGVVDFGETDPLDVDSDDDGLSDGVEDANHDGVQDADETSPTDADSDDDGWRDGDEDLDRDGQHDVGELDPLDADTDGDGVCDGPREDGDTDGLLPADACTDPAVVYVDAAAAAGGDGAGWASAFDTIQAAVDAAVAGDHVWVAAGTYLPAAANATVVTLKTGVHLLGGFEGVETALSQRPWRPLETTLSGDFGGDDLPDPLDETNTSDNSANIVIIPAGASEVTLDGFTISGGFSAAAFGAGVQGQAGASARLVRLVLRGNQTAVLGGALHTDGGDYHVARCTFDSNQSLFGAAWYASGGDLRVSDTVFHGNAVASGGYGGWFLDQAAVDAERLRMTGNFGDDGTAVYATDSTVVLTDLSVMDNSAVEAIFTISGGFLSAVDATFARNATLNGPFLNISSGSAGALLTNASFWDNFSTAAPAIVAGDGVTLTFRNTAFWQNVPNVVTCNACTFGHVFVCGEADLDLVGEAPQRTIDADPFVAAASGHVMIDAQSDCVDAGSVNAADGPGGYLQVGLDWRNRTTRLDLAPDATPVDAGRHHDTGAPFVLVFDADETDAIFETSGVASCDLSIDEGTPVTLAPDVLAAGWIAHGGSAGDTVTLTCWGIGLPVTAEVTVP